MFPKHRKNFIEEWELSSLFSPVISAVKLTAQIYSLSTSFRVVAWVNDRIVVSTQTNKSNRWMVTCTSVAQGNAVAKKTEFPISRLCKLFPIISHKRHK